PSPPRTRDPHSFPTRRSSDLAPWWIARTRCGEFASSKVKVNFPWASDFVWPASSMPAASLMRMTSTPAEGLLVVPLVTVPVRLRSEEHTSELQSLAYLVCRLL